MKSNDNSITKSQSIQNTPTKDTLIPSIQSKHLQSVMAGQSISTASKQLLSTIINQIPYSQCTQPISVPAKPQTNITSTQSINNTSSTRSMNNTLSTQPEVQPMNNTLYTDSMNTLPNSDSSPTLPRIQNISSTQLDLIKKQYNQNTMDKQFDLNESFYILHNHRNKLFINNDNNNIVTAITINHLLYTILRIKKHADVINFILKVSLLSVGKSTLLHTHLTIIKLCRHIGFILFTQINDDQKAHNIINHLNNLFHKITYDVSSVWYFNCAKILFKHNHLIQAYKLSVLALERGYSDADHLLIIIQWALEKDYSKINPTLSLLYNDEIHLIWLNYLSNWRSDDLKIWYATKYKNCIKNRFPIFTENQLDNNKLINNISNNQPTTDDNNKLINNITDNQSLVTGSGLINNEKNSNENNVSNYTIANSDELGGIIQNKFFYDPMTDHETDDDQPIVVNSTDNINNPHNKDILSNLSDGNKNSPDSIINNKTHNNQSIINNENIILSDDNNKKSSKRKLKKRKHY